MKRAICQTCGKQIAFIMLASGKFIPVNPDLKKVKANEGENKIVTPDGRFVKGRFVGKDEAGTEGYQVHFGFCKRRAVAR